MKTQFELKLKSWNGEEFDAFINHHSYGPMLTVEAGNTVHVKIELSAESAKELGKALLGDSE